MLCFTFLSTKHNSFKNLHLLQEKSLRIIFFQRRNSHTGLSFKVPKFLKSSDKTALQNFISISKSLRDLLTSIFNNWFKFYFESHTYGTRWSNLGHLKTLSYRAKTYGRYSMFVNAIYVSNRLQSFHQSVIFII